MTVWRRQPRPPIHYPWSPRTIVHCASSSSLSAQATPGRSGPRRHNDWQSSRQRAPSCLASTAERHGVYAQRHIVAARRHCCTESKHSMDVSKGVRARIPGLLPHQRDALQRWASRHCAQAVLLDGDPTVAILLGLRDTPRTSASHARTLRAALHQMAATPTLKGRWCTLVSAAEVLSCVLAEESARRSLGRNAQAHAASTDLPDDDEERVVTLR